VVVVDVGAAGDEQPTNRERTISVRLRMREP
jgi:hypothetical protein